MRSSMTKLRSIKKFEIVLDSNKLKWFYMSCAAALPQLDRGSDYESERHRFESYTPHQLKLKASGNGGFFYGNTAWIRTSVEARASRKRGAFLARGRARRQAGEAGADPRSGCAESYTPHQLKLKASGNGGFSFMATPHGFEPRSRRERLNHHFVKFFQIVA